MLKLPRLAACSKALPSTTTTANHMHTTPRCLGLMFDKKAEQYLGDKPKDILGGVRPGKIEFEYANKQLRLDRDEKDGDAVKRGFVGLGDAFQRWQYKTEMYCRYGLLHDDLLSERSSEVKEAIRRLPENIYIGRSHRQHRAIQLNKDKIVLPKEMWTAYDDPDHHYLTPYLKLVQEETVERQIWNSK